MEKLKESNSKYKSSNKKKLVEDLWKIRREEKFSDWSDVKKRLKLI